MPETWTVQKVLEFAADFLKKNSVGSPRLESEILLAHALNTKRINLYIKYEKELSKDQLAAFRKLLLRRRDGEPSAYMTGIKPFMSLEFSVTGDVLIPRPETEMLVESALDILRVKEDLKVLDIGTGSGAIAISIAKYAPRSKVYATDISSKAIDIARMNAEKLGVAANVVFEVADLFPPSNEKFDIIISNPPYIRSKDIASLPKEVKDFEPLSALDGGDDGLKYYHLIFSVIKDRLSDNGTLLLEIDPVILPGIKKQADEHGLVIRSVKKDLNEHERVAVICA